MDTIQSLRGKAQTQGNLASTDKQKVIVDRGIISIEPVRPQVVYIPAYDPCLVYGPWWYSSCSPPWFWYPHIVIGAGFFFGPPVFLASHHFWSGFFWHRHRVFIHVNKTIFFHKPRISKRHGGMEFWQHSPRHRRGVAYHDRKTAEKFGQSIRPGADARREFRGFSPRGDGSAGRERLRTGTGRERIGGQPQGGTPLPGSRELRRQGSPEPERLQTGRGTAGSGRIRQQRRGNAFEAFGTSGPEVRQNSERGRESIGGRFRQGGSQRFDQRMQSGSGSGSRGGERIDRSSGGRSRGGSGSTGGGGSRRGDSRRSR